MEVFDGYRALLRPLAAPAIAIGNFDGVHRGHLALLAAARAAADRLAGDAVIYTFDPPPAAVLAPDAAPPLITGRARKLELIQAAGIDVCVLEPFTRELALVSPAAFVDEILLGVIGARHIVVGYDFHYGHRRAGDIHTLRQHGERVGVTVEVIDAVPAGAHTASSTRVRQCLSTGDLAGAQLVLGRPFDVDGEVVRGAGRGRQIGVPTANIATGAAILPANGIYAVRVMLLDDPARPALAGAASLGTNPTFAGDGAVSLEVHLLDLDEDLYGRPLRVVFIARLRSEERYDSVDELIHQIQADIIQTRRILDAPPTS